jgi:hypothetical protein
MCTVSGTMRDYAIGHPWNGEGSRPGVVRLRFFITSHADLNKIPDALGSRPHRGNTFDDNTTAEGSCTVSDGLTLNLCSGPRRTAPARKDYIYQTAEGTQNGCIPQPDNLKYADPPSRALKPRLSIPTERDGGT